MARLINKSKKEIGISPDELLFRGEKKINEILLRVIDFDANNLTEETIKSISDSLKFKAKNTVTWLNIDGLHNTDLMESIASEFNFDRLILADVMNTQARSTVKEYDNCIFVSVKMLQQASESDVINVQNLSLIFTDSFLISFQERKGDVFEPVQ